MCGDPGSLYADRGRLRHDPGGVPKDPVECAGTPAMLGAGSCRHMQGFDDGCQNYITSRSTLSHLIRTALAPT